MRYVSSLGIYYQIHIRCWMVRDRFGKSYKSNANDGRRRKWDNSTLKQLFCANAFHD
jgi:hypothetical protein